MTLRASTGLIHKILDSGLKDAFDSDGRINIYTGSQPADADTAPSGTLLGTLNMSATGFSAAASKASAIAAVTSDTNADNTGTAGWFRIYKSADGAAGASTTFRRLDGAIGTDMAIDNASVVAGGTIALSGWSFSGTNWF